MPDAWYLLSNVDYPDLDVRDPTLGVMFILPCPVLKISRIDTVS